MVQKGHWSKRSWVKKVTGQRPNDKCHNQLLKFKGKEKDQRSQFNCHRSQLKE